MQLITVIVETLKGSTQKYNYDSEKNYFKLKKILPLGMAFPFDFGFIPGTKGEDGDPLDVMIISEFETFTGCAMDCRIIGCLTAEQTEEEKTFRNDRFIAIPAVSLLFADIKTLENLPKNVMSKLETFFIIYNDLQGKIFKPLEILDAQQALQLLKSA